MNQDQVLAGTIANDLFRVVNLYARNAHQGALVFLNEAKKTSLTLKHEGKKEYIKNIADKISKAPQKNLSPETLENYLMYAVLMQNYSLPRNTV